MFDMNSYNYIPDWTRGWQEDNYSIDQPNLIEASNGI